MPNVRYSTQFFFFFFLVMTVTGSKMDFIPSKATRKPDICVNEVNRSRARTASCAGMRFFVIHIQEFGGDSFELIHICLCKKYSLCIHIQ